MRNKIVRNMLIGLVILAALSVTGMAVWCWLAPYPYMRPLTAWDTFVATWNIRWWLLFH
jgi:hypothetical protein